MVTERCRSVDLLRRIAPCVYIRLVGLQCAQQLFCLCRRHIDQTVQRLVLGADDYIVSIINIVAVRQSRFVTFRIRFISVRNRSAVLLLIGTCAFLPGLEVFVQIVGHQRYRRGICDLDVPALQVDIVLVAQIAAGRNILTAVRIAERYAFDLLHCRTLCHDMALHHVHSQQNAYI